MGEGRIQHSYQDGSQLCGVIGLGQEVMKADPESVCDACGRRAGVKVDGARPGLDGRGYLAVHQAQLRRAWEAGDSRRGEAGGIGARR